MAEISRCYFPGRNYRERFKLRRSTPRGAVARVELKGRRFCFEFAMKFMHLCLERRIFLKGLAGIANFLLYSERKDYPPFVRSAFFQGADAL